MPPSPDFTCKQQREWGKCDMTWMQGMCLKSCGKCNNTDDANHDTKDTKDNKDTKDDTDTPKTVASSNQAMPADPQPLSTVTPSYLPALDGEFCSDTPPSATLDDGSLVSMSGGYSCARSWLSGNCARRRACRTRRQRRATTRAIDVRAIASPTCTSRCCSLTMIPSRNSKLQLTDLSTEEDQSICTERAGRGSTTAPTSACAQSTTNDLDEQLQMVRAAGGNVIRMFLHADALQSPVWNAAGRVEGNHERFLADMKRYLSKAESLNLFVIFSIFDFYLMRTHSALYTDESVLTSFIEKSLRPMLRELKDFKALAAWEIGNEPEGASTQHGWTKSKVDIKLIQRASNRLLAACKEEDPHTLVTLGSWSMIALQSSQQCYWCDDALIAAGGMPHGVVDFYQTHVYDWMKSQPALFPLHHARSRLSTSHGQAAAHRRIQLFRTQ